MNLDVDFLGHMYFLQDPDFNTEEVYKKHSRFSSFLYSILNNCLFFVSLGKEDETESLEKR